MNPTPLSELRRPVPDQAAVDAVAVRMLRSAPPSVSVETRPSLNSLQRFALRVEEWLLRQEGP